MASEKPKKGTFRDFYGLIKFLLPGFRGFLVNRVMVSFFYEGLKLIPIYLVKLIVDDIFGQPNFTREAALIAAMFLVLVVMTIVEVISFHYILKTVSQFQKNLLERLHKKLLGLSMAFHEKQSTGSIMSKINKSASYVGELLWFFNNDIIPTLIQIILTSILLFMTEWRIALVYVGVLPIMLWLIGQSGIKAQPYRAAYHQAYDEGMGEMTQSIYNVKTVQEYIQEEREQAAYKKLLGEYVKRLRKRWIFEMKHISIRESLINIIRAVTMAMAVWFVIEKQITPGDLVLIFTLTEKAFINLYRLGRVYNFLGDAHESLNRTQEILLEKSQVLDEGAPKNAKKAGGAIEFKEVEFSYDREKVIKKMDIVIPPKKVIAIIGASGAGKSTLVKLLTRHYDVSKGAILLDGVNIRKMPKKELRGRIAIVSQHTEIFNRSIYENIAYANPKAARNQVIDAAKKANAHEFIMSLKNGYDTVVGERGIRLSGGQQQRISIARALLANPEILIFDEATSSLDSESESAIQKALFAAKGRYTMIIIAHRLSTIEHADIVVVLGRGAVVEMGTHAQLLAQKDSLYKKMRQLQRLGELRP